MPIYEYACDSCGKPIEAMQGIRDAPLKKCPHCGKMSLRRLISLSSFQLKGSGWYATDYGRNGGGGNGPSKKTDEKAAGKNGEKTGEKADEKPAEKAKTEAKTETAASSSSDD